MSKVWYSIKGETLTQLADEVRRAGGETGSLTTAQMIEFLKTVPDFGVEPSLPENGRIYYFGTAQSVCSAFSYTSSAVGTLTE